jgi:hypothetical protein
MMTTILDVVPLRTTGLASCKQPKKRLPAVAPGMDFAARGTTPTGCGEVSHTNTRQADNTLSSPRPYPKTLRQVRGSYFGDF